MGFLLSAIVFGPFWGALWQNADELNLSNNATDVTMWMFFITSAFWGCIMFLPCVFAMMGSAGGFCDCDMGCC